MILPRGITGFGAKDGIPCPIDPRPFIQLCYAVAIERDATIGEIELCTGYPTPNFHRIRIREPEATSDFLCNAFFPIIAVARPLESSLQLDFHDADASIRMKAEEFGFDCIAAVILNSAITPQSLQQLASAELAQIHYWKPTRLGEVIFNYWD